MRHEHIADDQVNVFALVIEERRTLQYAVLQGRVGVAELSRGCGKRCCLLARHVDENHQKPDLQGGGGNGTHDDVF